MKSKFLIIFSAFFITSSLLFSGCFSSSEPSETAVDIDHSPQITEKGILKKQEGAYLELPGTHYLERKGKTNLAIGSLGINLDDKEFLENEVEVTGETKENDQGKEFLSVNKVNVLKVLKEELSWEKYKNQVLGFSIAYQSDWELDKDSPNNVVRFASENTDTVSIARLEIAEDLTLKEALENEIGAVKASTATNSKIGVDQLETLKVNFSEDEILNYYLKRENYLYVISFTGSPDVASLKNRNTFHEMLLEFRLIPIDESAEVVVEDAVNGDSEDDAETARALNPRYNGIFAILEEDVSNFSSELSGQFLKAEFVGDSYVYVEMDGSIERSRKLFKYDWDDGYVTDGGSRLNNTELVAYYRQGEVTDWILVTGQNPVAGEASTIYRPSENGDAKISVLKEGFRYFESARFGFRLQYPSDWYFAGRSDSNDDIVYHYGFSDESVTDSNELVSVDVVSAEINDGKTALVFPIDDDLTIRVTSKSDKVDVRDRVFESIELIE